MLGHRLSPPGDVTVSHVCVSPMKSEKHLTRKRSAWPGVAINTLKTISSHSKSAGGLVGVASQKVLGPVKFRKCLVEKGPQFLSVGFSSVPLAGFCPTSSPVSFLRVTNSSYFFFFKKKLLYCSFLRTVFPLYPPSLKVPGIFCGTLDVN